MSPTTHQPPLKKKANTAAADPKWQKWHSGGNTGAFRCNCAISAASPDRPACINCQFSALLP